MGDTNDKLELIASQIVASKLATKRELLACSESEITSLEEFFGLRLPESYKMFLRTFWRNNVMADQNTRPLSPGQLQDDLDAFAALKNIGGYTPSNPDYSVSKIQDKKDTMETAEDAAAQAKAAADAARDNEVSAQWAFHEKMIGAKDQVKAQFGNSSNEIQAMGLKKKSEYKSPSKKQPTP